MIKEFKKGKEYKLGQSPNTYIYEGIVNFEGKEVVVFTPTGPEVLLTTMNQETVNEVNDPLCKVGRVGITYDPAMLSFSSEV